MKPAILSGLWLMSFCACVHDRPLDEQGHDDAPTNDANLGGAASQDGEAPGTVPMGWNIEGSGAEHYGVTVDTVTKHGGRASAMLRSLGPDAEGFATLMQSFPADAYRGKRVRLTAWIRSESVSGWAGAWMRVDDRDGKVESFDNMQNRSISGTTDWDRYEVVLDVSDDADHLSFGALLAGDGRIWMDDFSIEPVDRKRTRSTDLRKQPTLPFAPRNLAFTGG